MIRCFSLWIFLSVSILHAQAPEFEWKDDVKCARNTRTLALLEANDSGAVLLRLERVAPLGKEDPIQYIPWLVYLDRKGKLKEKQKLPELDKPALAFHFALPLKDQLLVAYSERQGQSYGALYVRRLDVAQNKWLDEGQLLAEKSDEAVNASNNAWFCLSENERYGFIFALRPKDGLQVRRYEAGSEASIALRNIMLPRQNGALQVQQAFCSNNGDLILHARIFSEKDHTAKAGIFSTPFQYDRRGLALPEPEYTKSLFSNAFFRVSTGSGKLSAFYPNTGKYSTLPAMSMNGEAQVLACGFWGEDNSNCNGYYVYRMDLNADSAGLVHKSKLPQALRKAFLSEKEMEAKAPIPGLCSHRFCRATDGQLWLLCEQAQLDKQPTGWRDAALLRLDSSYKLNNLVLIEKSNKIAGANEMQYHSPMPVAAPRTGIWTLWNKGFWPNTSLQLTPSKGQKGKIETQELALSQASGLTLLPHCMLERGDALFMVGESEYREHFGLGCLKMRPAKGK